MVAPERLASSKSARVALDTPVKAIVRVALTKRARSSLASRKQASVRFAPSKLAPERFGWFRKCANRRSSGRLEGIAPHRMTLVGEEAQSAAWRSRS
jgi:hypothetical protein